MSYSSQFSYTPLYMYTPLCKGLWDFLLTLFSVKGCKNVHVLDYRNAPKQHVVYVPVGTPLRRILITASRISSTHFSLRTLLSDFLYTLDF